MKRVILIGAIAALGACNQPADNATASPTPDATASVATAGEGAGFEAVAPGNYEVVHADGSIDHMKIDPGMTWSMVAADGTARGGTIFAQGGENCFVTEGVSGHRCFKEDTPGADGSMKVTADDGEVATVKPVNAPLSSSATSASSTSTP